MQIKKRLRINNWISLIVAVLTAISLSWSFWEVYRTNWNENLVDKMQKTAFERIALRDDYLLNREERAGIQWHLKSEALRRLLETAAENFSSADDKLLLQETRENFDTTFSIFTAIIERSKREGLSANSRIIFDEAGTRQIGQVFLKSYALVDIINRLHESTMREKTKAQNRGLLLIIILFAGGGIGVIVNSVLLSRVLAKRLTALNKGVEIIGNGNLDYKVALAGDDELTDLARVVNETVAKLNQSYTSVENLQREIFERKQSEERYGILFNESLDGLCLADAETGIIIDCNKALAALVCRERAELIGQPQTILHPPQDDKEAFSLTFKKHLTDKKGQILETQVVTKTGDIREVEIKANFVVLQGQKMLHGLFHEITARKLAEEEIKTSTRNWNNVSPSALLN